MMLTRCFTSGFSSFSKSSCNKILFQTYSKYPYPGLYFPCYKEEWHFLKAKANGIPSRAIYFAQVQGHFKIIHKFKLVVSENSIFKNPLKFQEVSWADGGKGKPHKELTILKTRHIYGMLAPQEAKSNTERDVRCSVGWNCPFSFSNSQPYTWELWRDMHVNFQLHHI